MMRIGSILFSAALATALMADSSGCEQTLDRSIAITDSCLVELGQYKSGKVPEISALKGKIGRLEEENSVLRKKLNDGQFSKKEQNKKKDVAPAKKKKKVTKIFVPAEPYEDFTDSEGQVKVIYPEAFVRAVPNLLRSSIAEPVHKNEIYRFNGKSPSWYRLKSGLYISRKVVIVVDSEQIKPKVAPPPLVAPKQPLQKPATAKPKVAKPTSTGGAKE